MSPSMKKSILVVFLTVFAIGSGWAAMSFNLSFDYSLSPSTSPTTASATGIAVENVMGLDMSILWKIDEKMSSGFGVELGTWTMKSASDTAQNKMLLDVYLAVSEYRVELKKGISFVLIGRGGLSTYDFKEWATTVKVLAGLSFYLKNLTFDVHTGMESRYFSLSRFLYSGYPVGASLRFNF